MGYKTGRSVASLVAVSASLTLLSLSGLPAQGVTDNESVTDIAAQPAETTAPSESVTTAPEVSPSAAESVAETNSPEGAPHAEDNKPADADKPNESNKPSEAAPPPHRKVGSLSRGSFH